MGYSLAADLSTRVIRKGCYLRRHLAGIFCAQKKPR